MPTMPSRARYWKRAIRSFRNQTWPQKELLIGLDAVPAASVVEGEDVRTFICPKTSLGAKRNFLNQQARGSLICHWDDDDWSAPDRIESQVRCLRHDVIGCRTVLFWDEVLLEAYRYRGTGEYVIGSSLMYRHRWWWNHRFDGLNVGEDNTFVGAARAAGQLDVIDSEALLIATSHAGNTSAREYRTKQWERVDRREIPESYFET